MSSSNVLEESMDSNAPTCVPINAPISLPEENAEFLHPTVGIVMKHFTITICGPTRSGKNGVLHTLLVNFVDYFDTITVVCPRSSTEQYEKYKHEKFRCIPFAPDLLSFEGKKKHLVVFDDLLGFEPKQKKSLNAEVDKFFTTGSGRNISSIILAQDYYDIPKTTRKNATYCIFTHCEVSTLKKEFFTPKFGKTFNTEQEDYFGYTFLSHINTQYKFVMFDKYHAKYWLRLNFEPNGCFNISY